MLHKSSNRFVMAKKNKNPIRNLSVVGGSLRSRRIVALRGSEFIARGMRPTKQMIRETLFNYLRQDVIAARCLDLYAGSGALGIEAISRGAKQVDFVENHPVIFKNLQQNIANLGIDNAQLFLQEADNFIKTADLQKYDIIFLDPPFIEFILNNLLAAFSCCKSGTVIYFEQSIYAPIPKLPPRLSFYRQNNSGDVFFALLVVS